MKYFKNSLIICAISLLYSSCEKKANYPDVPVISYNNFTFYGSGSTTDSALLRVNFTDGNGNIGYVQQEGAPTDFFAVPLIYVYSSQSYQPLIIGDSDMTFSYSIPNITPKGSDKELNGIIQINFEDFIQSNISSLASSLSGIANVYNIEFKVWMYDNAGNKSNVIITPPLVNPYN